MRIQVSEEQYRNLVKKVFGVDVLKEQDDAAGEAAPKAGTSSDGEKKTNATKWESGVTRGPANQIGVTKWSDIVGASLKRGKANPLTEENIFEEPKPTERPIDYSDNKPQPGFSDNYPTIPTSKILPADINRYPKVIEYNPETGGGVNRLPKSNVRPPAYDYDQYSFVYNRAHQKSKVYAGDVGDINESSYYPEFPPVLKNVVISFKDTLNNAEGDLIAKDIGKGESLYNQLYLNKTKQYNNLEIEEPVKTYAPPAKYVIDENKYDFISTFESDKNETLLQKYRTKQLTGINTFKTYWGRDVNIDCDKYEVLLWQPNEKRRDSFNITGDTLYNLRYDESTKKYFYKKYPAPPEYYLKAAFPNYTIKTIIDKNTKERYSTWLQWRNIRNLPPPPKPESIGEKLKKVSIEALKFAATAGIVPLYDYLFKEEKKDTNPKYTAQWVVNSGVGYGKKVPKEKVNGVDVSFDIVPFKDLPNIDDSYNKIIVENFYHPENEAYRIAAFKSNSGKNVPEGFDPNRYDDYLEKIRPIQWRIFETLKRSPEILRNLPSTQKTKIMGKAETEVLVDKSKDEIVKDYDNYFKNLSGSPAADQIKKDFEEIDKLYKTYRSPIGEGGVYEFSHGISPEERELYYRKVSDIQDWKNRRTQFLKTAINVLSTESEPLLGDTIDRKKYWINYRFWYDTYYSELKEGKPDKVMKSQIEKQKMTFGYDYWEPSFLGRTFDEVWDDWGFVIQLIGNAALIFFTGGIAGALELGALTTARLTMMADTVFNGLIAAYQFHRSQNEEGFLSSICAIIPYVKYVKDVGKLSPEVYESLAKAIKSAPKGVFQNKQLFETWVSTLDDQQRFALRNVYSMPRSTMIKLGDDFIKEMEAISSAGKSLDILQGTAATAKIWWKNFGKEIGFEAGAPLLGSVVNSLTGWVKDQAKIEIKPEQWMDLKNTVEQMLKNMQEKEENMRSLRAFSAMVKVIKDPKTKEQLQNSKDYTTFKKSFQESLFKEIKNVTGKDAKQVGEDIRQDFIDDPVLGDLIKDLNKKGENLNQ